MWQNANKWANKRLLKYGGNNNENNKKRRTAACDTSKNKKNKKLRERVGAVGAVGDRGGWVFNSLRRQRYKDKEGYTRNTLIYNNLQYI